MLGKQIVSRYGKLESLFLFSLFFTNLKSVETVLFPLRSLMRLGGTAGALQHTWCWCCISCGPQGSKLGQLKDSRIWWQGRLESASESQEPRARASFIEPTCCYTLVFKHRGANSISAVNTEWQVQCGCCSFMLSDGFSGLELWEAQQCCILNPLACYLPHLLSPLRFFIIRYDLVTAVLLILKRVWRGEGQWDFIELL